MATLKSKVYFIFLTTLLVGGFPNFMAQEAHAVANLVDGVNIANDNRVSGDGTVVYDITGTDGTGAVAGTITFVRTGGTADTGTHTYTMDNTGGEDDLASSIGGVTHTKDFAELKADAGFDALVAGTIYTLTVEVTDPVITAVEITGVIFDDEKPTMVSASVTSGTTIDVTFNEDILDAEAGDFTLDFGLTVNGIAETDGVVTITTNELISTGDQPTITLGADFVTDIAVDVGSVNTAVAGTVTVGNNAATFASDNGGGCDDCEAPTLGLNSDGKRMVENGFSYNGRAVDAERFFTPYPLIIASVGKQNTAVFKIYEDKGPENIKHFSLAFGLDKGQIIGDSKAMIELDIDHEGTETVTVTDPENALDNIKVSTNIANCNENDSDTQCLIVTIDHKFRAPLDFNIVATDVWDMQRNSWQNYFNHGIEVTGESLNPAKEYDGINAGIIYHLTETSKTSAVDEFGDSWTLKNGAWIQDYILPDKVRDSNWKVMNRMHSDFAEYKEIQNQKAIVQLLEICPSCLESFTDFDSSFAYEISNEINKLDNQEIIQKMILENDKAQEIMDYLLDPVKYGK